MSLRRLFLCGAAALLAACGGGNSVEVTGPDPGGGSGPTVELFEPSGDNTTEVLVDSGPSEAFALGVVNLPYVTVTVCAPGSDTACRTIDHVLLDTGSIGLRLLRSTVDGLGLPPQMVSADPATGTPAGQAVECYPFVIGAIWGPVVRADVRIGGLRTATIPVQLADDGDVPAWAPTADCRAAAADVLLDSVTRMQAKGVLGVGMLRYDCGRACDTSTRTDTYVQYYACSGTGCAPARMLAEVQVQNPIVHLPSDNNGSSIVLPAIPEGGAALVRGRLVLGVGTQTNNQPPPQARRLFVETDPASAGYLYVSTTLNGRVHAASYIDSGSNGLFFDDPSLSSACSVNGSGPSGWYCPAATWRQTATLQGRSGPATSATLVLNSADRLFGSTNVAFADLGGTPGDGTAFAWGLPFFYGRTVSTTIWEQPLAVNGPWWAY